MSKIIEFGPEARTKLVNGIDKLANAVTSTLGPNGRNVVIANQGGYPQSTKDGVTVAKNITLEDPIEELGVQMVKQAAIKTAISTWMPEVTVDSVEVQYNIASGIESAKVALILPDSTIITVPLSTAYINVDGTIA